MTKNKTSIPELWKEFVLKIIDDDKSAIDNGWRWLCAISLLLDINQEEIRKKLPKEHPLEPIKTGADIPLPPSERNRNDLIDAINKVFKDSAFGATIKGLKDDLKNPKKIKKIDFSGLPFKNKIDFSNFIFPIDTDFSNTTFSKDVYFTNAVFFDTASFKNAEFHGETANFRNATFEKEADFEETTFKNYANFKSATFSDRTIFQLAKFELHAPRFYGAKFNNELILNRIKLPEAKKDDKNKNDTDDKLYEKRIEENKSAYETLIHLMEKQNKHHERHRFFREEMRWRQLGNKLTEKRLINAAWQGDYEYYSLGKLFENSFTIAFFWLYDTTSEYGHGIGRAFGWWLLHILVGAGFIALIAYCGGLEIGQVAFCSFAASFANANPFVFFGFKEGGLMECYECLHDLSPLRFGTIRGIQTLIGIPLLFILLTTLRVRFRIK